MDETKVFSTEVIVGYQERRPKGKSILTMRAGEKIIPLEAQIELALILVGVGAKKRLHADCGKWLRMSCGLHHQTGNFGKLCYSDFNKIALNRRIPPSAPYNNLLFQLDRGYDSPYFCVPKLSPKA